MLTDGAGALSALALVISGCTAERLPRPAESDPQSAILRLADSVFLAENDTLLLGRVTQGFSVDDSGHFFVAASSFGRIIRFSHDGTPIMTYGRLGDGPGESRSVFPSVLATDRYVLGTSSLSRRLNIFGKQDAAALATLRFGGFLTSLTTADSHLVFGNLSRRDSMGVGIVRLDSLLQPGADNNWLLQPKYFAMPVEYSRYSELEVSSDVRVTVIGNRLVAGYPPFSWIMVWDPRRPGPDTIVLPSRLRRGVPDGIYQKHFVRERWDFNRSLRTLSLLEGLWTLPDGRVAAVHMDVYPQVERGKVVHVVGRAFLTLVDLDRRAACVDAPIPSADQVMPVVTVSGGHLHVLEQVVTESPRLEARTYVRSYSIDPSPCTWVPFS